MSEKTITLCLGHDISSDKPNGCPKANECARHTALTERNFPSDAPITGSACATLDYVLFMPVKSQS